MRHSKLYKRHIKRLHEAIDEMAHPEDVEDVLHYALQLLELHIEVGFAGETREQSRKHLASLRELI